VVVLRICIVQNHRFYCT